MNADLVAGYVKHRSPVCPKLLAVAMVIGEAAATRKRECASRMWVLDDFPLSEVDEQHHPGILRSVFS